MDLKVVVMSKRAFEFFMGFCLFLKPSMTNKEIDSICLWYMKHSEGFTKPVKMKIAMGSFKNFILFLTAAHYGKIKVLCSDECFILQE